MIIKSSKSEALERVIVHSFFVCFFFVFFFLFFKSSSLGQSALFLKYHANP